MKKIDKKQSKNISKRKVPSGVKTISIVGFIFAALFVLSGVFSITLGIIYSINPESVDIGKYFPKEIIDFYKDNFNFYLMLSGIIFIVFSLFFYKISKELFIGKNWARIVIIVFSLLSAISDIFSLINKKYDSLAILLLSLLINVFIVIYLFYDKKAKEYFLKR